MDANRLKAIPIFGSLDAKTLEHVARQADEVDVAEGKTLAQEGDIGWEFFAIERGAAEVTIGDDPVRALGPGDFFGELAMIEEEHRRTATVKATEDSTLVVLTRQAFNDLRREAPEVAAAFLDAMATYRRG
jgi:CRP-like cAMP-binding protein